MGSSPIASIFLFMRSGALAQLGARNIRIVEAVGSNPICSMFYSVNTKIPGPYRFGWFRYFCYGKMAPYGIKNRSAGIFMGRRETLPQKQPAADGEARLRASLLFRPYVQPHCCMPTSAHPDIFRSPGPDRLPAFQAPRPSDPMPCPPAQYPRWGWWNRRSGSDPWPWRPMKRSYFLLP